MAKVTGVNQLRRRLRAMETAPKQEIKKEIHKQADRMVNLSKALAPEDDGDLKASIRKTPGRHELSVNVVAGGARTQRPVRSGVTAPTFDYAAKIEGEQPYFFPAYRALRKSIKSALTRAYKRAAKLS